MDQMGKKKYPLTQLRGLYIETPPCRLTWRNSSSSPLYNADKIFVIEQGRITEAGTHHELMEAKGTYCKLIEMQQMA